MALGYTETLLKREDIQELISSPRKPTLNEIGSIARDMGITSALELWDLFDKIQVLWAENKTYFTED